MLSFLSSGNKMSHIDKCGFTPTFTITWPVQKRSNTSSLLEVTYVQKRSTRCPQSCFYRDMKLSCQERHSLWLKTQNRAQHLKCLWQSINNKACKLTTKEKKHNLSPWFWELNSFNVKHGCCWLPLSSKWLQVHLNNFLLSVTFWQPLIYIFFPKPMELL